MSEAGRTIADIARVWMTDPTRLAEAQGSLLRSYADLWNNSVRRLLGEDVKPVIEPDPSDNRFKDPEWSSNPYFDFWKQAYLLTTHWAEDVIQQTEGLDERTRQKAEFYFRQMSSAFSPSTFQLIQYAPTTDKVREAPLLVVPPWINKYYILDLTPAKSFLKFAVDQGFTVFVISWVNPDQRLSHKSFEDYMIEGLLTASDAVKRETGVEKSNVLGYCVGGTLLGGALAYLAARGEAPFRSATFLTTQLDFTRARHLLLFSTHAQLAALEEMMAERGYLDGSRMANVFNMMRPKDLIWPYIVNNYLLGKKPFPFDLLYWNQDSTRMPAANHNFYLREFYNENRLAKGEMAPPGVKLNLKKVKLPIYELATKEDHIAPARSVFIGATLCGGPVEFVLAGSGHIAGVVNPPDKVKYQFWTAPKASAETLEEWLGMANEHPRSCWPHWSEWLPQPPGGG